VAVSGQEGLCLQPRLVKLGRFYGSPNVHPVFWLSDQPKRRGLPGLLPAQWRGLTGP